MSKRRRAAERHLRLGRVAWRLGRRLVAVSRDLVTGRHAKGPRVAEGGSRGEVDSLDVALLEDRILMLEGKPLQYGTQLEWDDDGVLSPLPIADAADVDVRRGAVGLGPLAERIEQIRAGAQADGEVAPADRAARTAAAHEWARSVGWRD